MDWLERTRRAGLLLGLVGAGASACGSPDTAYGTPPSGSQWATNTTGTSASTGQAAGTVTGSGGATATANTAGASTSGTATTCDTTLSGEQFYMQPGECVLCHGTDAQGVPELGPDARHPSPDYARWLIRGGREDHPDFQLGMPGYSSACLTDAMLEEILVFLNGFPKPTDGASLYADFCANCHGADGRGGVTGRSVNGELHAIGSITAEGHNPTDYGTRREYMPVMTDRLTQAEIQLITDYLQNQLGLAF